MTPASEVFSQLSRDVQTPCMAAVVREAEGWELWLCECTGFVAYAVPFAAGFSMG